MAYYPIEFQGTNAKGFGDYASGMAATCTVSDDLDQPLGSINEGLLSATLKHVDAGSCPPAASAPDSINASTRSKTSSQPNEVSSLQADP